MQIIENLRQNYLKIVSNIYYVNLLKVQKKSKSFFDANNVQANQDKIDKLYKEYLNETRNQVLNHFNILNTHEISLKTALRIFIHYLNPYEEVAIKNSQFYESCNLLLGELETCGVVEELSKQTDNIKPRDVIIEFN